LFHRAVLSAQELLIASNALDEVAADFPQSIDACAYGDRCLLDNGARNALGARYRRLFPSRLARASARRPACGALARPDFAA
jgi:hypothetical protein